MVFSSVVFLFGFFPLTFLGYYLIRDDIKNYWLLLFSILFYAWGEPNKVFLILFSTLINFYLGLVIDNQSELPRRRIALTAALLFNLGILIYFKYSAFFAQILFTATGFDLSRTVLVSQTAMPIGISFFTFQILSYQIDVYRKDVPVQKRVTSLALYIMLFPQMIAGPIVRYSDVEREINCRQVSLELTYEGLRRFMTGFAKKILISNTMAVAADYAYANIGVSGALSWLGAVCYMLQIYYDFSGYSDMAIGMGKMAGFHFAENFDHPYLSVSMRDFWHRWHISLSSWFRDYLYIPLGGNRRGVLWTYFNQLIVFFVTGLWHGASFNFIVWGLFHGVFLCAERLIGGSRLEKIPRPFMRLYSLFVVLVGWVFFRAETLGEAVTVLATMLSPTMWRWRSILPVVNKEFLFFLVAAVLCVGGAPKALNDQRYSAVGDVVCTAVFGLAILYVVGTDFNPFIYFRF